MNANELADELQVRYKHKECSECMLEAATMLRQQQAEIEALKSHPVKELTDEEIWELAKEIGWKEVMIPLIIPLGRAILRKAQEK
jgi:hypothetical protein